MNNLPKLESHAPLLVGLVCGGSCSFSWIASDDSMYGVLRMWSRLPPPKAGRGAYCRRYLQPQLPNVCHVPPVCIRGSILETTRATVTSVVARLISRRQDAEDRMSLWSTSTALSNSQSRINYGGKVGQPQLWRPTARFQPSGTRLRPKMEFDMQPVW